MCAAIAESLLQSKVSETLYSLLIQLSAQSDAFATSLNACTKHIVLARKNQVTTHPEPENA